MLRDPSPKPILFGVRDVGIRLKGGIGIVHGSGGGLNGTSAVAAHSSNTIAGLLNASLGNVPELIVTIDLP